MLEPIRKQDRRSIASGVVSQGFSSATSFGLSFLAARIVGPSGLGRVFLGFAVYQIVLGLLRALLIEPLIARSSAGDERERISTASTSFTIAIVIALVSSIGAAIIGALIGGSAGRALLITAPWIPGALLLELWRWILFRDERPATAAVNDAMWLVLMIFLTPVAWWAGTDWAVVACWGIGAMGGAVRGFLKVRPTPEPLPAAWRWWRREMWPFGRWVAATHLLGTLMSSAAAFVVAAVLGTAALGGLRAAETVFAPLSLIIPALALPGLPAIARASAYGDRAQRSIAIRISALALGAAALYVAAMIAWGVHLLPIVFGPAFGRYDDLLWPFAISQIAPSIGLGMALLLTARQRGGALLLSRTLGSATELGLVAPLSNALGVVGAAWAAAIDPFITTVTQAWLLTRRRPSQPKPSAVSDPPPSAHNPASVPGSPP